MPKKRPAKAEALKRVLGLVMISAGFGVVLGLILSGWGLGISLIMIALGWYMLYVR
jgi:hypothetical protein